MITLEETVIRKLKTKQQVLCTIESCTGGLIANLITNVPGASEIFWGGVVAYDNSAKEELGVPLQLITNNGSVSFEVAEKLAEQGLKRMQNSSSRTDSYALIKPHGLICISTTGIAGPSGGTREKPVGLCFIGIAFSGKKTRVDRFQADSSLDRIQIKIQFANRALEMIRESI